MTKDLMEEVFDIYTGEEGTITFESGVYSARKWYNFVPTNDITLWELAQVVEALDISIDETILKNLHPDVQSHFEEKD